jgi:ABC-type nitrate/sulfonate/bicarbonate transport system ATPase subunit
MGGSVLLRERRREDALKLTISHLTHSFGTHRVLHDIDLNVAAGEFVCILGASGCGKSTLFNAVSGLLEVDGGRVLLEEEDIAGKPGRVGYMLQKDLLLPWRTALDNIVLGASLRRGANAADRARAGELASHYGLGAYLHHYPWALSGGMRQRVALMRTIAAGHEVMLLDEPFAALDSLTRFTMQRWLLEVWSEMKRTIVFVTHDVDEALVLADRIVVMLPNPGRIGRIITVGLGRPREIACMASPAFMELKSQALALLYASAGASP